MSFISAGAEGNDGNACDVEDVDADTISGSGNTGNLNDGGDSAFPKMSWF